jgi:hypothetical protein
MYFVVDRVNKVDKVDKGWLLFSVASYRLQVA